MSSMPPLPLPDPLRLPPASARPPCVLLAHVLCGARVPLWQMVKRGELPEPTTAAHLAKLTPTRVGGKMTEAARRDPSKAKYVGKECCGGTRVWGMGDAAVYKDACGFPRPCLSCISSARTAHPLAYSALSVLLFAFRNRNDFAVFVCGGCTKPLPLPSSAAVPMPSQSSKSAWDSFGAKEKATARMARTDHPPAFLFLDV